VCLSKQEKFQLMEREDQMHKRETSTAPLYFIVIALILILIGSLYLGRYQNKKHPSTNTTQIGPAPVFFDDEKEFLEPLIDKMLTTGMEVKNGS
jgi:hypothetical protein